VSDRLRKQVEVEREQLRRLIEIHQPLINDCASRQPTDIELSAFAFFLETFYSGIENIFKRIAVELDGALPQGDAWHRKLLDRMARDSSRRPAVISPELTAMLDQYLSFRHVSHYSYSFHLQWSKMASLVSGCEETMQRVENEIDQFLRTLA
jgi:hypothetical protein